MGLEKEIQQKSGVVTSYHRLTFIGIDLGSSWADVAAVAGSYITYEARKSGASSVDQTHHSLALTPSETAAILTILYEAFSRQTRMEAEAHILPEDIPAGDFFTEAFREAIKKEIAPTPKPESEEPHDEDPDETPDNSDAPRSGEGN